MIKDYFYKTKSKFPLSASFYRNLNKTKFKTASKLSLITLALLIQNISRVWRHVINNNKCISQFTSKHRRPRWHDAVIWLVHDWFHRIGLNDAQVALELGIPVWIILHFATLFTAWNENWEWNRQLQAWLWILIAWLRENHSLQFSRVCMSWKCAKGATWRDKFLKKIKNHSN